MKNLFWYMLGILQLGLIALVLFGGVEFNLWYVAPTIFILALYLIGFVVALILHNRKG